VATPEGPAGMSFEEAPEPPVFPFGSRHAAEKGFGHADRDQTTSPDPQPPTGRVAVRVPTDRANHLPSGLPSAVKPDLDLGGLTDRRPSGRGRDRGDHVWPVEETMARVAVATSGGVRRTSCDSKCHPDEKRRAQRQDPRRSPHRRQKPLRRGEVALRWKASAGRWGRGRAGGRRSRQPGRGRRRCPWSGRGGGRAGRGRRGGPSCGRSARGGRWGR
jgi:hypothetical protein